MTSTNDATVVTYNRGLAQSPKGGQAERLSLRYGLPSFIQYDGVATGLTSPPGDVTGVGADGAYLIGNGTAANRGRISTPLYFKHEPGGNPWSCRALVKYGIASGVTGECFVGMTSTPSNSQEFDAAARSIIGVRISGADETAPTFEVIAQNFSDSSIGALTLVNLGTLSVAGPFPRYSVIGVEFDGTKTRVFVDDASVEVTAGEPSDGLANMMCFHLNNNLNNVTGKLICRELALGYESTL